MVPIKESNWSPERRKQNFAVAVELEFIFFKSPSSEDVVKAKSNSSSSLTLHVVEVDSNSILTVTLKSVDRKFFKGRGQSELIQYYLPKTK